MSSEMDEEMSGDQVRNLLLDSQLLPSNAGDITMKRIDDDHSYPGKVILEISSSALPSIIPIEVRLFWRYHYKAHC